MYDIDEIRIVNSWLFKNQDFGYSLFLEQKSETAFIEELEKTIREIEFE
jgi:hypothetical protein